MINIFHLFSNVSFFCLQLISFSLFAQCPPSLSQPSPHFITLNSQNAINFTMLNKNLRTASWKVVYLYRCRPS